MTSRTGLRAAWLLLAPSAIANAAAAMHLPDGGRAVKRRGIARGAEEAAVRLFTLSPTLMLVLAAFAQVAPYRDGPAGVHAVLAQAAVGVSEIAELRPTGSPRRRRP